VAVTVQDADEGDTATSRETLIGAAENAEVVVPDADGLEEVVGDKGYHSKQELTDLEAVGVRSYISEPERGRRNWKEDPGGAGRRLSEPPMHSWCARQTRAAPARGTPGTPVCASVRNRSHAARPPARSRERRAP
jgi:hypothetical protein